MANNLSITLIIPCYNEETRIQMGVLDKIGNYTLNDKRFKEIIIVDDGSTDNSKKLIKEKYLQEFHKFKLIENNHQGKAFAIITGIQKATSDYTMFTDIDLATPIEESEKLIKEAENGYDIVIGSRKSRREGAPITRKILSVGAVVFRSYVIGLRGIHDTQCGFKLFKREAAMDIIHRLKVFHDIRSVKGPSVSAGFDMEFLFIAVKRKYKLKEVPVTWKHVETRNVNFVRDISETLRDIFRMKYYEITHQYNFK